MSLPTPNLDDRDFKTLLEEAKNKIKESCPSWTDLSPNDPGIVLLEVFAYLTETMLYRLNRLPEKVYIEFLKLLDVKFDPPTAATTKLKFTISGIKDKDVVIPKGTRVETKLPDGSEESVIFSTTEEVIVKPDTLKLDQELSDEQAEKVVKESEIAKEEKRQLEETKNVEQSGELDKKQKEKDRGKKSKKQFEEQAKQQEDAEKSNIDQDKGEGQSKKDEEKKKLAEEQDKEIEVWVPAVHGEWVDFYFAAKADGNPGLIVKSKSAPIVKARKDKPNLIVAVEISEEEFTAIRLSQQTTEYKGKKYRIWQEVRSFIEAQKDSYVYLADRLAGTITFAPALHEQEDSQHKESNKSSNKIALAAIPEKDKEILLAYRLGGGNEGNVGANTLTILKDPIKGVNISVTNPEPVVNGRDAESLENALKRAPSEVFTLNRAVTVADYKFFAERAEGVIRAHVETSHYLWKHAKPGTVDVFLITKENSVEPLKKVKDELESKQPIGASCNVQSAQFKNVNVELRAVIDKHADSKKVRSNILERLSKNLSSISWGFGQTLHKSHIYDIVLKEPSVRWVDQVNLSVEKHPKYEINSIVVDTVNTYKGKNVWYVGSYDTLFRSINDGDGWEEVKYFPEQVIEKIAIHPKIPGIMAVLTSKPLSANEDTKEYSIHITQDSGENPSDWQTLKGPSSKDILLIIKDLAWEHHYENIVLYLATEQGLYKIEFVLRDNKLLKSSYKEEEEIRQFLRGNLNLQAVVTGADEKGENRYVIVAENGGVYQKVNEGRWKELYNKTDQTLPAGNDNIIFLAIQNYNEKVFLWAGANAIGTGKGGGCFRLELFGEGTNKKDWKIYAGGHDWSTGGSCYSIAFLDNTIFASSHGLGILQLKNPDVSSSKWKSPDDDHSFPSAKTKDSDFVFEPIKGVAINQSSYCLMGASYLEKSSKESKLGGVYKALIEPESDYQELQYTRLDSKHLESITIPANWLLSYKESSLIIEKENEIL